MLTRAELLGLPELLRAARCHTPDKPWHALRHTFAAHAVMSGIPLYTVKELLGHPGGGIGDGGHRDLPQLAARGVIARPRRAHRARPAGRAGGLTLALEVEPAAIEPAHIERIEPRQRRRPPG